MRTYARRYIAALIAITIATAFIVAINALSRAAREGSEQAVDQQYRNAAVAVRGTGSTDELDGILGRLDTDDQIGDVAVNWLAYGDIEFADESRNTSIGSVAAAPALRWQQLTNGRWPAGSDEISVSASRAAEHGVKVGDRLTVGLGDEPRRFTVTGTVKDVDGPLQATAYLPETAFRSTGEAGFPLDVVATADDPEDAVARLADKVGDATVTTGDEHRRTLQLQATRGIDVFQKLIFVFAGISLFVGALVIANTFTILLAQRARDLALLRCVGAVRAQVARSVLWEGALLGAAGSALGVVLGFAISFAGTALVRDLSATTPMASPSLSLATLVVPMAVGILVTVASTWAPARRAGASSPLGALQPADVAGLRTRAGALRTGSATVLLLVGVAGLVVGMTGSLPVGMAGGMLSFIGIVLLAPVLVPAAIRATGPLVRLVGPTGRLAHLNSLRNPRRTAATSTALLIGVTLISAVVVGSSSISHKVNSSLDTSNPVDLTVSSAVANVPSRVIDELDKVDGLAGSAQLSGVSARVGAEPATVLGVDRAALDLLHGEDPLKRLGGDQILVPLGWPTDSDVVTLQVGEQQRELRVVFGDGLGDVPLVRTTTLEAMDAKLLGTRAVWLRAEGDADPGEVTSDVTAIAIAKTADLDLAGGLPDRADILHVLDVILAVTVGLLAIAVLIALIGVGNTLSLSVIERVRENSLLRALGLGRRELRLMVAIEALLIAVVAAVLGIVLGTAYAWFGVRTTAIGVFEQAPNLQMPWGRLGLILLAAVVAGLAACVLPARRAASIQPATGLQAD